MPEVLTHRAKNGCLKAFRLAFQLNQSRSVKLSRSSHRRILALIGHILPSWMVATPPFACRGTWAVKHLRNARLSPVLANGCFDTAPPADGCYQWCSLFQRFAVIEVPGQIGHD